MVAVEKTGYAGVGREPGHSLHAADRVGGRRRLELGRLRRPEKVNALLGIPAKLDVLAILPFGYPAEKIGRGKKNRKPLAAVAHRERFGQPFE